ncbi:MAG: hypothetical protein Q9191_005681 [Dirinaria sp. TL-2023a]
MVIHDVDRRASGNEWLAAHGSPPVQELPGTVRRRRADERRAQRQRELDAEVAAHMSQPLHPSAQGIKSAQSPIKDSTDHMLGYTQTSDRRTMIADGNRSAFSNQANTSAYMQDVNAYSSLATPAASSYSPYGSQNPLHLSLGYQQRLPRQTVAAGTASLLPQPERCSQPSDQGFNVTGAAQDDWSIPFESWHYGYPPGNDLFTTPYAFLDEHPNDSSIGSVFQSANRPSSEQNTQDRLQATSGSRTTGQAARPMRAAGIAGAIANPSAPPYQGITEPTDRNGGWPVTFVDYGTRSPLWTEPTATPSPFLTHQSVQFPINTRSLPQSETPRAGAPQATLHGAFQILSQNDTAHQASASRQQAGQDMSNPFRQMHTESEYDAYMPNLDAVLGRPSRRRDGM